MQPNPDSTKRLLVYLIEDEDDLREEMVFSLGELGFDVQGFAHAADFYKAYVLARCDVAVIDIGLPGEDGLSIAAHLRAAGPVGIVIVTARGQLDDRLQGLRQGADAYLVKPVHIEELAATLDGLGRRLLAAAAAAAVAADPAPEPVLAPPVPPPPTLTWRLVEGGCVLADPLDQRMPLSTAERAFLGCLFKHRNKAVSREDLIVALGGDAFDFDGHRVDAIASRVRRKALKLGMPMPLHAVRGTGYVFSR